MASSFEFIKRLGSGYFGEVWLAHDTGLDYDCALKCIPPEKIINTDNFYQEAQILKVAEHPNIVSVNETGILDDNRVYVSMEYLKNGSLEDEASGAFLKMSRAKCVVIDILRGLEYAHSKNIIHRDIKPANILIGNSFEGKLSDFGLALPDFSSINLSSIKKQYQYWLHLAPEVNSFTAYTYLSDIYSCGVTLYRLVNGDSYFPHIDTIDALRLSKQGKYPDRKNYREFIPRSLKLVINKALNVDPSKRYQSAEAMRHALEQVKIHTDWTERVVSNSRIWQAQKNNMIIQLSRVKLKPNRWLIETKKGRDINSLRRINRHCFNVNSKANGIKFTKKLLQDFVNGRE
jgi:serine/threonine protein kinase